MDAIRVIALLTLYGNFTTIGVVADCPEGVAHETISRVMLYVVEDGGRRQVHDLVRVGATDHYAGSLFWLEPDTEYAVEVEFYDRSGKLVAKSTKNGRTRQEPSIPETPKSLYVSPTGSDTNPGTIEAPLKTLKAAFAKLSPGTTLFVREGTYYEGDLVPASGGTKDAPVVVRNYSGERAVIDGAEPALISAEWRKEDGVYAVPFEGRTWNVTAEDMKTGKYYRLYPLKTKNEIMSGKSRYGDKDLAFQELGFTGAYHCDGQTIYVVPPAGDIAGYRVYVSRLSEGVALSGRDYVFFDGIEFRHFGAGDWGKGILVDDSSENLIQNCKFYYCNTGVWLQRASSNNTVQDCTFVDDLAHWHFTYTKTEAGWAYHGQIETGAVYTGGRYTGRGLVARRNRMEGLFDGAHLGPWVEVNEVTSETDFSYNTIIDVADDFIETDGYSRNVRIIGNVMDKSLSGISLAQALDGPTFILYNTIANSGVCVATTMPTDYEYEGYPVKTNGGTKADIGSGPVFFYHNTAHTADPKSRAWLVKNARWRLIVFRNNIWCGRAMGFDSWTYPLAPMDWDWDDLYREAGPFMRLRGRAPLETIEDARREIGVFKNGISADPQFVDAGAGDYHLKDASPCIDAGVVIGGINDGRYKGEAPDMGAFEAR